MKSISVALKAHYAQETMTLATCWKITRVDGAVFGFTDHTRDLTISGVMYAAATGYAPSNVATSSGLSVDNLEVVAAITSETVTDADMLAGKWDFASVEIFEINYADLTMGEMQIRKGTLGQLATGRTAFTSELRGMAQPLQQSVGRIYAAACDADLGDARCGVILTSYTVTGSVTTVISQHAFNDTTRTETTGTTSEYFEGGKLTWTSGLNTGLSMEVVDYYPGYVFMAQSMVYTICVGDTYSMHAGCDKLVGTCQSRFNNISNFRGFPWVPGLDRMVSGL
jgi:uncharacterized phage protein (TIGR02218 family)